MRVPDGLRSLLDAATLVRTEDDVPAALEQIARVIGETLGFRVVVTNLYRRAWDDYAVSTVYGAEEIRDQLLGCTYERVYFEAPLLPEFDHGGAFLIPEGAYDWESTAGERFVPTFTVGDDDDLWHAGDEIFVPFRGRGGSTLGIFCVGLPVSGRRPGDEELAALVTAVEHAGLAVEAAQTAAAASRNRRALEHLLRVSSSLTNASDDEPPLQLVVDGIRAALGFLKVAVYRVRGDALVPTAFAGWSAADAATRHRFPVDEFRLLFQGRYDHAGCYLVPDADARTVVSEVHQIYTSQMNGRGRHGWQGDWLLVPLHGRNGELLGVIWADDPLDRLRPGEETLQILRMFANHAAASIEAAADVAELHDVVARLRELDVMKDEFVALVSHELRTPLTSIQGYTELLRDDLVGEEQQAFLDVIERSTGRLLTVVNELLLVAQLQAGKVDLSFERVDVATLLDDAAENGRVAADAKQLALVVDTAHGVFVEADRSRFGQVLDNLVSNALKFTDPGGRIELRCTTEADTVVVEVADTGIGVPQDEQEKIFTKFFRTSNARDAHIPGTGLGLAITLAIVEAHDGTIRFTSEEGVGTTFRIELPLAVVAIAV